MAVEGQDEVTGLKIRNVKTEEEQLLPVDGVFIAVGVVPNTEKLKELMDTDENGYIIAGEDCVTTAPGLLPQEISVPSLCARWSRLWPTAPVP